MKRIGYASVVAFAALSLVALSLVSLRQPAGAQDPAKDPMATDVKQAINKFVAAINSGDLAGAGAMISTKSQVSTIANGQIVLGPSAVTARLNKLLGVQAKYQFGVSNLNVANVKGLALVTGTYSVHLQSGSGAAAAKGAVTFLMEQKGKTWVIDHIHRSVGSAVVITQ